MPTQSLGRAGEEAVAQYLIERGCFVIQKNYRPAGRHEELDLIACDGRYLLFVEVKTRKQGTASAFCVQLAVTPAKQKRILLGAQKFLLDHSSYACYQPRFDVACVTMLDNRVVQLDYYPNAFEAMGME